MKSCSLGTQDQEIEFVADYENNQIIVRLKDASGGGEYGSMHSGVF